MALTRPIKRIKPVSIEAMDPGTNSEPACSRNSSTGSQKQRWHKSNERFDLPFNVCRPHRPPQKTRNDHALADYCGDCKKRYSPVQFAFDQQWQKAQHNSLE